MELVASKYQYTKKANEDIMEAIKETGEGDQNLHVLWSCRDAARKMEDVLFPAGGSERIVCTQRQLEDIPAV